MLIQASEPVDLPIFSLELADICTILCIKLEFWGYNYLHHSVSVIHILKITIITPIKEIIDEKMYLMHYKCELKRLKERRAVKQSTLICLDVHEIFSVDSERDISSRLVDLSPLHGLASRACIITFLDSFSF